MGLKLPLTAGNILIVKSYLKYICQTFQTLEIPYGSSGLANAVLSKGGTDRTLIAHMSLPVEDILRLLQDQGIVMIEPTIIRIVRPEDLNIPAFETSIIQTFSPSKKIIEESQKMTELYIELFDIENRLRYFIEDVLEKNFGPTWFDNPECVSKSIRDEINEEKAKYHIHVDETRQKFLLFSLTKHLSRLFVSNWVIFEPYFKDTSYTMEVLKSDLIYINDQRNFIAHCNFLVQKDRQAFIDKVHGIRKILERSGH